MNWLIKTTKNKQGFSLTAIFIVAAFIALAAWLLLPHYFAQLEKDKSMPMQAMLINISIAENAYYDKNKTYTDNWQELMPFLTLPGTLQITTAPVSSINSDYFFGFGPRGKKKTNGFIVTLRIMPDGKSGTITAARTGSIRHRYDLVRPFPKGDTDCLPEGKNGAKFCQDFLQAFPIVELKNLVPVSSSSTVQETNK